ncbi:MAG: efflux RND transporter permease subunit [Burkholderiales bacterium]|uniref:efflux RND transporter permease subunit n=1 Tax=Nitrosomonas sp. TaxID=42353 RepID=UPI001D486FED|nr:efflux RND transporter permease subunit [Nitrosomonas sp.]MCB1948983.1 efflux RND transporter permease subunit [Nitrosomonas sp.]MCP5242406.1 efflux RND transporter permease subunit [Burkholderiales bacterium]
MDNANKQGIKRGLTTKIVKVFTTSQLSILFLIISMLAGAVALILTPREEDPQIVVPVMDVLLEYPGASSEEVEKLAATPLEVLLKQIEGVEYVYSVSRPGAAVITVRYYVGQSYENSLIKTWNKLLSNQHLIPPGVTGWRVNPVEIDDVPIVLLTLSSQNSHYDSMALRRIADELIVAFRSIDDIGKSWVVGGEQRRVSIYADPARLAAYGVTLIELGRALAETNVNLQAGSFERSNRELLLEAGPHFSSAAEVGAVVIKSIDSRPVYLRDVARIVDGPADVGHYTRIGFGPAVDNMIAVGQAIGGQAQPGQERQMVTIALAKRKGSNAVTVAEDILAMAEGLHGTLIPQDVLLSVTRDYGETANHKVNELVKHLCFAIVIIMVLLAFSLGPKEAFIVSIAVPMTLALTLLLDYLTGYTINRVTLFALILSLGLLVDDPIVDVENIHRHYQLRKEPPLDALLTAVDEVRPPTILATFTVIVSFLPMFFITGMMGPYMAPMAFNVPVAMLISLIVAFTVTPWASYKLLQSDYHKPKHEASDDPKQTPVYRIYRATLQPLLATPGRAWVFLLIILVAFLASVMLAVTRAVPLKLLPFDNKNELQIVIDMPRGSTLEQTDEVARALGRYLATVNEVTDYQTYTGVASPMDFNGMVRRYYLRNGGYMGDVRINLLPKDMRRHQSHEIALRIRPEIERIGKQYGANLKIVEIPPGPPVLASLVAEIYGPPEASIDDLVQVTKRVRTDFETIDGVVDVDDFSEALHDKIHFQLNREKAALAGVSAAQVARTLRIAAAGDTVGIVHVDTERQPLEIMLQLPRALRSSTADLLALRVKNAQGDLIPLGEIATATMLNADQPIYHKNLHRVHFVVAEMAGRSPVEAVFDLQDILAERPLPDGFTVELAGEGEWKITVDVFRDLGLAFAAALVMIYILLVGQTASLTMPLVMMIAIPLTIIGIMPGFWLLNLLAASPIEGYPNPIFFTATAMIGMIALAGIVVRNSIILVDFIERIRARGDVTLAEALIEAGAIRLRPIFLTAAAAMFGAFVIILDPIFSGLAWSFIFGIFASTLFSLLVIPVVYFLIHKKDDEETLQLESQTE